MSIWSNSFTQKVTGCSGNREGSYTFCSCEAVGLYESPDTSAKPLKECMKRGKAVLAEETAQATTWKGEAMSNIVEKGGYFDMAEALVFGEMMIRRMKEAGPRSR